MRFVVVAAFCCVTVPQSTPYRVTPQPESTGNRLYIDERVETTSGAFVHCDIYGNCYGHNTSSSRNVSLKMTRELVKTCRTLTVTDNREVADYVLRISPGSSTLYRQNGDVAYVSPAKWRVSNLAKDVCSYIRSHTSK